MWQFVSGSGYDMLEIQWGYLNYLKKGSSTKRRSVLEITGDDVADFVEELLKNTRTYPTDWKSEFNHEIQKSLK